MSKGTLYSDLSDLFWSKVEVKDTNECWNWTESRTTSDYGRFSTGARKGFSYLAHRTSWMLVNGAIPRNMAVLHKCDNRLCVNPSHLFLGTQVDNMVDMSKKNRHGMSKLTVEQVLSIKEDKRTQRTIASSFGVSQQQISRIKNGVRRGAICQK